MLAELSDIRSMDVVLPTRSGPQIRTCSISRPADHQQILLEKLRLKLPAKIIQRNMQWKLLGYNRRELVVSETSWGSCGSAHGKSGGAEKHSVSGFGCSDGQ
jgi:hypothetical protein